MNENKNLNISINQDQNNLINIENGMTNNINKEHSYVNVKDEHIKKKLEIKVENQIEIHNKNSQSKSIKLMDSWSQTNSEEISPIFPLNNKQATKKIIIFTEKNLNISNNNENRITDHSINNSKSSNINNTSPKNKNDSINIFQNLFQENDEGKKGRISKLNKENNINASSKKEQKNIFTNIEYDLLDSEIINEEEIKKFNLNQITLRFIDVLYKNVDKIKKKVELKIYDEKIIKIANMIAYMKTSNQLKVLECLRKGANSYNKKEIFERLEKKVDELNKLKKHGFNDNSNISKSSILSKHDEKKYSERMIDAKYNK